MLHRDCEVAHALLTVSTFVCALQADLCLGHAIAVGLDRNDHIAGRILLCPSLITSRRPVLRHCRGLPAERMPAQCWAQADAGKLLFACAASESGCVLSLSGLTACHEQHRTRRS